KPGKTIVFHATDSDSGYQIREGDQKIGSIEFLPPKTGTEGKAKELWLFQALTGLPSLAYGDKINGKDTAKVKAAMKRLRPAVKGEVLRRRMGLEKK
ncbi:MAG TPA: hypothetical protein VHM91_16960, partial [Verrucomicrobiales bacterium]|nr:hypothetical protein [Verrucomicrobiales bacterium]